MMVVVVIGIISAIAIPSYLQYVIRANRAAAQGTMLEVASRQERFLLDQRGYAADIATLTMSIPSSVSNNYTVTTVFPSTRTGAPPMSYEVIATPIGRQLAKDTACGTLTLYETGQKLASGPDGTSGCWRD
jgi:type IV pilus assembly protein PilE